MHRITLFRALVIAIFVLPGVACSGLPTYTRAAGDTAVGPPRDTVDRPGGGIMNRDEYEHSPSYPPG
jgi:hypothetical protein